MEINDGKLRQTKVKAEQNSKVVETIVNQLVAKYNKDLQELTERVKQRIADVKRDPNIEFDIGTLEGWLMEIPTFMYFSASGLELLGIEGDNATAIRDEAFNLAYQEVEGTIKDKQAHAELHTFNERIVEIAFQRAYKKLKTQLYHAELMYKSISKIYTKRAEEENFDRQEGKQIRRGRQAGDY